MAKSVKGKRNTTSARSDDPEFSAMRKVYAALRDLDPGAQVRVLEYVFRRLELRPDVFGSSALGEEPQRTTAEPTGSGSASPVRTDDVQVTAAQADGLEGISPVAQKWIRRNGLDIKKLSTLYSLGGDEIDLVAQKVPGKRKTQRLRSILLLLGVASYLGSGAPRITYDRLKEACGHYDAQDQANFASNMKELAAEVAGTREAGYTLTPRGLTAATDLVKQMAGG